MEVNLRRYVLGTKTVSQNNILADVECVDVLQGVCMFAWNCVEAGGKHLGTCIDRYPASYNYQKGL